MTVKGIEKLVKPTFYFVHDDDVKFKKNSKASVAKVNAAKSTLTNLFSYLSIWWSKENQWHQNAEVDIEGRDNLERHSLWI